ncbi:MAG: hypothetical protein Q9169_008687 [Polycauliona sp. 2 TL-2023]
MFQDPHDAGGLKEDFRNRFRNTVGYGTALKVLFEYEEHKNGENPPLRRTELVALVNTLDRVARSLAALGEMRAAVLKNEDTTRGAATSSPSSSVPSGKEHLNINTEESSSPPTFDDIEDEADASSESILEAFKSEFGLVFRTLFYVLRSWIEFPFKLIQISVLEVSRAWNYWLGLPVQPRNYVWEFDLGEGRAGRGRGQKGEL